MKKILLIISLIYIVIMSGYRLFDFVYGVEYFSNNSFKEFILSDEQYKQEIIKDSEIKDLKEEHLISIVGPYELAKFIKDNDKNPQIYHPSMENRINKTFQANFHSHTTNSDGKVSVQEMLDMANEYAQKIAPKSFYLAITDHNNMQTGKDIIKILYKNPEKYKNLKLVLGLEVFSSMEPKKFIVKKPIDIHIVSLAINPYDKDLNKVFYNRNNGKHNYSYRTFESAISLLNEKGLVGIAHPARYIRKNNIPNYKLYIIYLYQKYKYLTRKSFSFTEAYYQSYSHEKEEIIEFIKKTCKNFKIYQSGSIDNHGKSFFSKK